MDGCAANGRPPSGTTIAPKHKDETTDINRWRLRDNRGEQTWHYLETEEQVKAWPQTAADRYFLGLPSVRFLANRKLVCSLRRRRLTVL